MSSIQGNTIGEALAHIASDRREAVFCIDGDRALSFCDLDATSRRLAGALLALGLRPGDRVGLLGVNSNEWIQLFFAIARIGCVVVALSPRYRDSELEHIVRDCQVKVVFTTEQHEAQNFIQTFDRLSPELPSLERVYPLEPMALQALAALAVDDGALTEASRRVKEDQLALVIYTSGTTGRPKGVGLTHRSMLTAARAQADHMQLRKQDVLQLCLPLNHVGGITICALSMMLGGGTIDLIAEFKADLVLRRMSLHPPSLVAGVPTMMQLLLSSPLQAEVNLDGVRLIFVGGSNADPELLDRLMSRMPHAALMNLYGLSETSGAIVMTPWDCSPEDLSTSIGSTIGDAEVKVIDPCGAPMPVGMLGELCFRGAGVFGGYLGSSPHDSAFTEDGWLRTGDLGSIDDRGFITLKGRSKDMYIQAGFNVYPAETEAFIARHPGVLMVAGIGVPDPVLGEIGRYYIIRRGGNEMKAADVISWCEQGLADYKIPRQVVFCDTLPLTPAGKIHKAALREAART
jgi:acyl-CoA synthetase (AMP-forming)/AMP-acid ligase II